MPSVRHARLFRSPVVAGAALVVSVCAYVVVTLLGPSPFEMVDLRVYYDSSRHLFDGASLYTFEASSIGLPFTYPPFAAVVFAPIALLPWTLCRVVWQLGSLAALWFISRATLRLARPETTAGTRRQARSTATLLTALALWMEPVRSTLNYGQINLFIAAALLAGLTARRNAVAGLTVGLCAAVKLIPGATALYYLLAGRLAAVATAVATATAAVGIGLLISPALTRQFFTDTVFRPARAGDLAAVNNQSLRGAFARILHHDVVAVWLVACVLVVVLGSVCARTCLWHRDRLGAFLAVQLTGLLISPISWNHHWIWALPLMIWAATGPLHRTTTARWIAAGWLLACCSFVVSIGIARQTRQGGAAPEGWAVWTAALYPVLGLLTIVAILACHRRLYRHPPVVTQLPGDGPPGNRVRK